MVPLLWHVLPFVRAEGREDRPCNASDSNFLPEGEKYRHNPLTASQWCQRLADDRAETAALVACFHSMSHRL